MKVLLYEVIADSIFVYYTDTVTASVYRAITYTEVEEKLYSTSFLIENYRSLWVEDVLCEETQLGAEEYFEQLISESPETLMDAIWGTDRNSIIVTDLRNELDDNDIETESISFLSLCSTFDYDDKLLIEAILRADNIDKHITNKPLARSILELYSPALNILYPVKRGT